MMKSVLILTILHLFSYAIPQSQDASAVLNKAEKAYQAADGLEATFSMAINSPSGRESMEGRIQMRAEKFTFVTPDMQLWYDGTTQWTYIRQNGEVNVSIPDANELLQINPVMLLKNWSSGYTALLKGDVASTGGIAAYSIELTPKRAASSIKTISLDIGKVSSLPLRIKLTMTNGIENIISIHNLRTGLKQPDTVFVFKKEDYPDADIIDLR
jgi:outer membrane lipoprotein-sorting protein